MATDKKISFFHGKSSDIDEQIAAGIITPSDFVVGSDDDVLYYIDESSASHALGASKTKEAHTVELGTGGSIGSLKTGDVLDKGIDLDTLIKKLTVKQIPPTYTAPKVSISTSSATTVEVGASFTPALTATFTKNDAGDLSELAIYQDGTTNAIVSAPTSPATASPNVTAVEGTVSFYAKATYAEGAVKNDNLGEAYPTGHIAAGSITSSKVNFTGKRNAFYGTGVGDLPELTSDVVRSLGKNILGPSSNTTFSIPVTVGQQYVVFAYPATLRDVSQVMYVETNDTGAASKFTKSTVSVEGANSFAGTNYKVYSYQMATPAAATMTFKVTI